MKRGLVIRDRRETPDSEWEQRVATFRETLTDRGITVALIYADVSRSDDLSYLTNLCLYWNESILAVPAYGPPELLTKLSLRVQNWMRTSSTVTAYRGGRTFAGLVEGYLSDRPPGTLGLVDAALWPAAVVAEIAAAVPGWRIERLSGLVREQRLVPSAGETALLRTAAGLLDEALDTAIARAGTPGERVEVVERALRGAGFLDLVPLSASTSDGVDSFEVAGQYRTVWVQAGRLAGRSPSAEAPDWARALEGALAAVLDAVRPGATPDDLEAAARPALARLPAGARAEVTWVDAADLSTAGELRYPGPPAPLAPGAVGAAGLRVVFGDGGHAAVCETVRVTDSASERLTGARP